jgi:glycosyltransferase involved in cell wall biosynthesis
MLISVCICTYNRCTLLEHCLQPIKQLIDLRPKHAIEVIVIDNNSNDETSVVVSALIPSFPFKLRYVFEAEQGLSAARNRAIDEAQGDYLAFLDDECSVPPDWLSIAVEDINEFRPMVLGGPYVGAFLPGKRPQWFKIEYGNAPFLDYGFKKGFQETFRASAGNMIVHRSVFGGVRFDINLGLKSDQLKLGEELGEEIELQERYLRAHPSQKILYDPNMIVQHFIRPEKMKLSYRARRIFANQLSDQSHVRQSYGNQEKLFVAFSKAFIEVALAPLRSFLRNREKYPFWQNYIYEIALPSIIWHLVIIARWWWGEGEDQAPRQSLH